MSGAVGVYLAGVDRLMSHGVGLFPASGGGVRVGGDGVVSMPSLPSGVSAMGSGVEAAGGQYERQRLTLTGVDGAAEEAVAEGEQAGQAGRGGAGAVRENARVQGAAIAPETGSPAGVKTLVSTMDSRLADMQRQLDTSKAQNQVLAARVRQLAAGYQMGGGRGGGFPMSGLGGMPTGGGGGGFPGLSGLSGLTHMLGAGGPGLLGKPPMPPGGSRVLAGDLPPGVAPEKGLQKDTVLAARAVSAAFPEIKDIGGVRPDSLRWHPNGQAIDVMIPNPSSPEGKALGDRVLQFALAHKDRFNMNHIIWHQTMYNPDGSHYVMGDRGSPTQNHMDHVHIATNGGGLPRGGERYHL